MDAVPVDVIIVGPWMLRSAYHDSALDGPVSVEVDIVMAGSHKMSSWLARHAQVSRCGPIGR